jgi:hypothetical protein
LRFTPNSLNAAPGSFVVFQFYPSLHSVTQSSFSDPCHPLNSTSIFSGFVSSSSGPSSRIFTVPIINPDPIYLYCSQPSHCESGMVMAINAPVTGNTLGAYQSAAEGASDSTSPSSQPQGGNFGPTPDGTCGGTGGYTCSGSQGGIQPCCSSGGFWWVASCFAFFCIHLVMYQFSNSILVALMKLIAD